jgi:TRAP-type C4-dicarboxylate transport system permease small subunit
MRLTNVKDRQRSQSGGITGSIMAVSSALNKGTKTFDWVVAISIVFIVGSTVLDIISRTVFLKTLPLVRELSLCLLIVIIWGGAVYTLREKGHVDVTVFTDRLNPRSKALLKMVTCAISAFCCIFGTYSSWFMFKKAVALKMLTPVAGIPITPFKGLILVAFVLLTLQFLGQGFEAFGQFRSYSPNTEEEKKEVP